MKCTCETCKHCGIHPDGNLCTKRLMFVNDNDYCDDWDTDKFFSSARLVAFTIIVIGVAILLSRVF